MPVFGSFSLLLALALSAYTLLAGGIAHDQSLRGLGASAPIAFNYLGRFGTANGDWAPVVGPTEPTGVASRPANVRAT